MRHRHLDAAAHVDEHAWDAGDVAVDQHGRLLAGVEADALLVEAGRGDDEAVDLLAEGDEIRFFRARRVATRNTHGTGCTLSSALACYLARGLALADAVDAAKSYLTGAIAESGRLDVGGGHGPVHHFHAAWPVREPEVR